MASSSLFLHTPFFSSRSPICERLYPSGMVTRTVRGSVDVMGAVVIAEEAADTVDLAVRVLSDLEYVEAVSEEEEPGLLVSVG